MSLTSCTARLLLVFFVALGLRIAVIFAFETHHRPVGRTFYFGYETGSIAGSIAKGKGYNSPFGRETGPTAWIAPVYPYMVAGTFKIFGLYTGTSAAVIFIINSIFSAATSVLAFFLGRRLFSVSIGWYSAWLWAVFPIFIRWATTWVWDTALCAFLIMSLLLLSLRMAEEFSPKRWAAFGFLWGFALLTNPAPITFLPASLAYAAWGVRSLGGRWRRLVVISTACVLLSVAPWLVRNYVVFNQFVFIRSNFGFEFSLGNYHLSNGMGWSGKHPVKHPGVYAEYVQKGEIQFVRDHARQGIEFVRKYPWEFFELCLKRARFYWTGEALNYDTPGWEKVWMYLPWSVASLLGIGTLLHFRRREGLLLLWLLLAYPFPYYLTYPGVRYRHAIEPVLVVLTTTAVIRILQVAQVKFSKLMREPALAGSAS